MPSFTFNSQCVTGQWEITRQCSQCNQPVSESAMNLRKCYSRLETLFPEIKYVEDVEGDDSSDLSENVTVTRLNGESFDLPYNGAMTVGQLKTKVNEYMNVHPGKQSLLYNGQKLKVSQVCVCKFESLRQCSQISSQWQTDIHKSICWSLQHTDFVVAVYLIWFV